MFAHALLLIPSVVRHAGKGENDRIVRDVVLLYIVFLLDRAKIPIVQKCFVALAFFSIIAEIINDLTYKVLVSNPILN